MEGEELVVEVQYGQRAGQKDGHSALSICWGVMVEFYNYLENGNCSMFRIYVALE